MKLPAYPKYKTSGVEWLGDVPEGWEVAALKRRALIDYGIGGEIDRSLVDGLRTISLPNIFIDGRMDLNDVPFAEIAESEKRHVLLKKGDLLFNWRNGSSSHLGKTAYFSDEGEYSHVSFLLRVRFTGSDDSRFFRYLLNGYQLTGFFKSSKAGVNNTFNLSELSELQVMIPSEQEQTAIANFLDSRTAKLDALMDKKWRLIEKLKEKRSALISRTVTKGLPPEAAARAGLPKHPKLKPWGIEWLGEIPEGWQVVRFSREIQISEGQIDPELEQYSSMALLAPNHVESGTGRLLAIETAADQGAESGKYHCLKDDVVYSKIRPALRKVVIAPRDCLCSADMYPLRGLGRIMNKFLFWFLLSDEFSGWSILESDRVAMPKINRETLGALMLPIPPLPEQTAIAAYLDAETAKIDRMVEKVEAAIEKLAEYRTALITAAVTGKIDVRGFAL